MSMSFAHVLVGGLSLALGSSVLVDTPRIARASSELAEASGEAAWEARALGASAVGQELGGMRLGVVAEPAARAVNASLDAIGLSAAGRPIGDGTSVSVDSLPNAGAGRAAGEPLTEPVQMLTSSGVVYLPRGFVTKGGRFDLLIHFHGGAQVVTPIFEDTSLSSALLVVNLGIGSGVYEQHFAGGVLFPALLRGVETFVSNQLGEESPHVDRVALSAWSAGYGAVGRILANEDAASHVDAVLLADGLHAGFEPGSRRVDHLKMAPFLAFAKLAAHGDRLMGITHSDIRTLRYANTTETADYLLAEVGGKRTHPSARIGDTPLSSAADQRELHVLAFGGQDTHTHCEHLRRLGETLFPMLARRWAPR
jgi:hypothetical protein